jgi:transcriptional regulator with XRE-family HTH domain
MTNFNEMMKYLRTSRDVTQAELARAIGVSPSTVGMYETGERQPNFEIEEKIADYFNVSLDTLRGKQTIEVPIDYGKLSDINKEKLKAYYQALLDTQEK